MTHDHPFAPVCSRASFVETTNAGEALRLLNDGLGLREPFVVVTGVHGTGKTTLANEAVARWGQRVAAAFLAYPASTGGELLEEILRRFGVEPPEGANRSKLVACIERVLAEITARGQVAVLVVDDAHDLSSALLEELRLLANAAQQAQLPLEVLLLGLPTLETRFEDPSFAALRQRISVRAKLAPLSPGETRRYLHHRVTAAGADGPGLFSRKACREIASRTGGVPRQINALATESLRVMRAWGDQTVGADHLQTASAALGGFAQAPEAGMDVDVDDTPASNAPPRARSTSHPPTPALAPTPAVAPKSAPVTPNAAAVLSQPPPRAEAVVHATTSDATDAVSPYASPTPPATHDSREWVARFIGDKGPIQISSQVRREWAPDADASGMGNAESQSSGGPPPKQRGRAHGARPRPRAKSGGGARVALAASLAVIVLASAVALIMRASGLARSHARELASVASSPAARPSAVRASVVRRSTSAVARVAAPATPAAAPVLSVEAPNEGSAERTKQSYTLAVGEAPDLESALERRDRLHELTGFQGWVVPVTDDDGEKYRIVLGAYRTEARATDAANMLMNSKTLDDVTVVPLPRRSVRR